MEGVFVAVDTGTSIQLMIHLFSNFFALMAITSSSFPHFLEVHKSFREYLPV